MMLGLSKLLYSKDVFGSSGEILWCPNILLVCASGQWGSGGCVPQVSQWGRDTAAQLG